MLLKPVSTYTLSHTSHVPGLGAMLALLISCSRPGSL
jgi:hypothetical protein